MENFLLKKEKLIFLNKKPLSFNSKDELLISFDWITNCFPEDVLKIRNAEHVLKSLSNQEKISLENHLNFLSNYKNSHRIDFILKYKKDNLYVGGVSLVKTLLGWEIGKYIGDKNFEKRGIALRASKSLITFISEEFDSLSEIHAKTKIKNIANIKLNEKIGFKTEKILDHEFLLMKKTI